MPRIRFVALRLLAIGALAAPAALPADDEQVLIDGYTGLTFDSNISPAILDDEERNDTYAFIGLSVARAAPINERSALLFRAALEYTHAFRFESSSHVAGKVSVDYRWQSSRAPLSPWVRGLASLSFVEYGQSAIRSGTLIKAGPSVGKRLNDRIELSGGYLWDKWSTPSGNTFNVKGHRLFGRIAYDVSSRLGAYARYTRRWGQSVASVIAITPGILAASHASEADPAMGPTWTSWRFDSITDIAEIGLDFDIDDVNSVSVSGAYLYANGKHGDDYDRFSASVLYQRKFR